MKRIIVNADDFGLTNGINRAIEELYRAGVLTSATLMATGSARDQAVAFACRNPGLGVGCHIVLVDGVPVLPPGQIPTLVDPATGDFRSTLGAFVRDLHLGRIRPEEMEAEAAAQIALLQSALLQFSEMQSTGPRLTHIDTHKHTHLFPAVLRPLLRAAAGARIPAIRNPFEPSWARRATRQAPLGRRIQVRLLQRLEPTFRRLVAESGLATTSGAVGVLATGTLDSRTLLALLQAMPDDRDSSARVANQVPPASDTIWELVTHPGYNDPDLAQARTRLLASREVEREALLCLRDGSGRALPYPALISYAALATDSQPTPLAATKPSTSTVLKRQDTP